jgi:hypothetical protein
MLDLKGKFKVEHVRNGKVLHVEEGNNAIVNEGLDKILNVMFHDTSPIGTWYIGLVDDSGWTAFAAADTLAVHSGWTEYTDYTGNRQEWTEDAASSQAITNTTVVTFAMNATGDVKGIFVCSAATGSSGTLWSTAAFTASQGVVDGDEIKVTYTVEAANA